VEQTDAYIAQVEAELEQRQEELRRVQQAEEERRNNRNR
jgi:hypothetical protein